MRKEQGKKVAVRLKQFSRRHVNEAANNLDNVTAQSVNSISCFKLTDWDHTDTPELIPEETSDFQSLMSTLTPSCISGNFKVRRNLN